MVSLLLTMAALGLSVNLEPGTLVVFMILLRSERPTPNAVAFVVGWMTSLAIVFGVSYSLGANQPHLDPKLGRSLTGVLELIGAAVLLWVSRHEWVRRDDPRTRDIPKTRGWLAHIGVKSAFLAGVWEQSWTITMAAAIVVVRVQPPMAEAIAAFLVLGACSLLAVGTTYVVFTHDPQRTEKVLDDLKEFVAVHGPRVFAIVALIAAIGFAVDGTHQLLR